jgi:hypothetical protein
MKLSLRGEDATVKAKLSRKYSYVLYETSDILVFKESDHGMLNLRTTALRIYFSDYKIAKAEVEFG